MEKTITKKLLVILMIITILLADFYVLGSNLITYAVQSTSVVEGFENIKFSTYFENGESEIEKSINSGNLKLYAKIQLDGEDGCLEDIKVKLNDSNFNIKSADKGTVEGNVVKLDYIGAGTSVEIELEIEPITYYKVLADMKYSTDVELEAKYKHQGAPEGETVGTTIEKISVNYVPEELEENEMVELETQVITNQDVAVDGNNKRVVQLLVKSRIANNQYPVEYTTLDISMTELSQITKNDISVLALGQLATNGSTEISNTNYEIIDGEKLQITLENKPVKNLVNWGKDIYDELVVTFIYPENTNVSTSEITTKSNIKLYNLGNPSYKEETKVIGETGLNNVVIGRTEITTGELYKGQLYANAVATEKKEVIYNTQTNLIVTNKGIVDQIKIIEGPDKFVINEESKVDAKSKYKTTEINLEKMLTILGQEGNLTIKNGETPTTINKNTPVDANGNVVITHDLSKSTTQLEITATVKEPNSIGILEIRHEKVITETYTKEQLKTIKALKTQNTTSATLGETEILKNTTETSKSSINLKETTSKATLAIGKTNLSTIQANEVKLGIQLINNGSQYDLYKEPTITLQMPASVANVQFNEKPSIQQENGLTLSEYNYNPTTKIITLKMAGEQTTYPEDAAKQTYIQLNLNVTLSQLTTTHTDAITMTYVNKNASQYYDEGVVVQTIEISGPGKLVPMFNLSSNENTSLTETITQHITSSVAGKTVNFGMTLINDTESDMQDVRILGKLPTTGNTVLEKENTLETTLTNISNIPNATIYYSENVDARIDDTEAWTTDLSSLTNAKLYLIKLDTLSKASNCEANITVKIPNTIPENVLSYTSYEVIYDTNNETNKTANSRKIGLVTSLVAGIETTITAQVGQNILENDSFVKEGEVIRYTVTVENKTGKTMEGIELKAIIPEGTVLVEPAENAEYLAYYYEEKEDVKEISETITINNVKTTYTKQYEVRVKSDAKDSYSEIVNKATITYNNSVQTEKLTNQLEESNIRVTIKSADSKETTLLAGSSANYNVLIENLSNESIKNLKVQILSDNKLSAEKIKIKGNILIGEEIPAELTIDEISANSSINILIYGNIENDIAEMNMIAIVKDSNLKTYRSNLLTQKFPEIDATINLSSAQNGKVIKEGDTVRYDITVKNTGELAGIITVDDIIPDYLQIQEIHINGEIYRQSINENEENYIKSISNEVKCFVNVEPNAEAKIVIISKVKNIPAEDDEKVIINKADVSVLAVPKATSQEITHTLKSSEKPTENIKNRISGSIWLDDNLNGQKDNNETTLEAIIVKLYDISEKCYLADEEGNVISTVTNQNGEYQFTKIPNGSYIIIFECDTEKYEPTTYMANETSAVLNSKAQLHEIVINGETIKVIGIELKDLQNNIDNINVGLKNKVERPEEPDIPTTPEEPVQPSDKKSISGLAWLDTDRDGKKDNDETILSGIKVKLYNESTKNYLVDENGNIIEKTTDANGKYKFSDLEKGLYIVIFEYDTEKYVPTAYFAESVDTTLNSKAMLRKINIKGQEITATVTDTINVQDNISNINIGLKEELIYDLELNKYISRIVVQNAKGTKAYDYENGKIGKIEIHKKQMQGSLIVLEYKITIKNNGEIAGYAKNIVDYLPSGLTFSSELNKDWYISENNLHTKYLENVEIKPGEEKELKLILTKTMTNDNTGLINNRAEIYQDYNKYGDSDVDSTPNNQVQGEDDMSSVDVIIGISTGGSTFAYIVLLMINIVLIGIAIKLMIKNNIIKISNKKGGR